jgi:hypothetical protein
LESEIDDHEEALRITDPFAEIRAKMAAEATDSKSGDEDDSELESEGEENDNGGAHDTSSDDESSDSDEEDAENLETQTAFKLEDDEKTLFIR